MELFVTFKEMLDDDDGKVWAVCSLQLLYDRSLTGWLIALEHQHDFPWLLSSSSSIHVHILCFYFHIPTHTHSKPLRAKLSGVISCKTMYACIWGDHSVVLPFIFSFSPTFPASSDI